MKQDQLPCILIVDDERININVLVDLLKNDYRTLVAKDAETALKRASAMPRPDLILLDVMMPEVDGYEACRRLKAEPLTADIPIIFVTALNDSGFETQGFALGAVDYITKPISPTVTRARIKTHLENKKAREYLSNCNQMLGRLVAERTYELSVTQDITILALASLAETRDNETGNHVRRTQQYVRLLAQQLRHHPRFKAFLDPQTIELLFKSAALHDIGKVGIPDAILLKPGQLINEEFAIMKRHSEYGRDAILAAERALLDSGTGDQTTSFLRLAREITYGHHEKWDGGGYPEGLRGEAIPIPARLMAVADVYDALISRRVYKPPFSHEKAVAIIAEGAGHHFDPDVIAAFLAIDQEFHAIAVKLAD
ncbi:MAG: two-component system response regulator [Alphaproteobacteria bacterium]|nr:two-component system response regulator [Alphaproteobacteria bacterium]